MGHTECEYGVYSELADIIFTLEVTVPISLHVGGACHTLFSTFARLLRRRHFRSLAITVLYSHTVVHHAAFCGRFHSGGSCFTFCVSRLVSNLPRGRPSRTNTMSTRSIHTLQRTVLSSTVSLVLARRQLVSGVLTDDVSNVLAGIVYSHVTHSVHRHIVGILTRSTLTPMSLRAASRFVTNNVVQLFAG